MSETFTCARCRGTFEKSWTDEEADAERVTLFPNFPASECDLICDDCFKLFMQWYEKAL